MTKTNRTIFLKGMDIMMDLKRSIMNVRDLKNEGIQKIEAVATQVEVAEDVGNFYRIKIGEAQKVVEEKKNQAIAFFEANKADNADSIALFEKELEDAMRQHQG